MKPPSTQVELWIAQRLGEPGLFAGVTTPEERRERVRALIERRQLHLAIAGRGPGGKAETWEALYLRVYQQSLAVPRETRRTTAHSEKGRRR